MTRAVRLLGLVLVVLLSGAVRSEANIWDWIEALDGPGPSRSRGNLMANIFCSDSTPNRYTGRIFEIPRNPDEVSTCRSWTSGGSTPRKTSGLTQSISLFRKFGSSIRLHRSHRDRRRHRLDELQQQVSRE